jgi:hypothetical protein
MTQFVLNSLLGRTHLRKVIGLIVGACLLPPANAEQGALKLTAPIAPTQRVFFDNINLTARDFYSAYMSKSVDERRYAEMYLLGVLDSTEGTAWCSYRLYKTTTIAEDLYLSFKSLDDHQMQRRAAQVIAEVLSKKFPCGAK